VKDTRLKNAEFLCVLCVLCHLCVFCLLTSRLVFCVFCASSMCIIWKAFVFHALCFIDLFCVLCMLCSLYLVFVMCLCHLCVFYEAWVKLVFCCFIYCVFHVVYFQCVCGLVFFYGWFSILGPICLMSHDQCVFCGSFVFYIFIIYFVWQMMTIFFVCFHFKKRITLAWNNPCSMEDIYLC